jgi:hypothetical protein
MPPLNIIKYIARAGFLNILIKAFYFKSIKGLVLALNNIDFNTLIFNIINWPRL